MSHIEKTVDTLARYVLATNDAGREHARRELERLVNGTVAATQSAEPEDVIRGILLELGAPDHLKGHPYAVYGILMALADRSNIDSMCKQMYPGIAEYFNSTPSKVERGIRHLIDVICERADLDVLAYYFGNTVSANKGRPTNTEFIARMANIVRQKIGGDYGR